MRLLVAVLLVFFAFAGSAGAGGPAMMVGAAEDVARQQDYAFAKTEMDMARLAGLDAVRVTQAWTTGDTKLALHPASEENPAGSVRLGLGTTDIDNFYAAGQAEGLVFTSPPTDMHGTRIARFRDLDGAEISVSSN